MLKTLERLTDRFLKEGTMTRHPLKEYQHAYQRGKSTETALHSLVTKIDYSMREKQFALAVFMDNQGAFDSTTFAAIQEALESHDVGKLFFTIIDYYPSLIFENFLLFFANIILIWFH